MGAPLDNKTGTVPMWTVSLRSVGYPLTIWLPVHVSLMSQRHPVGWTPTIPATVGNCQQSLHKLWIGFNRVYDHHLCTDFYDGSTLLTMWIVYYHIFSQCKKKKKPFTLHNNSNSIYFFRGPDIVQDRKCGNSVLPNKKWNGCMTILRT